MTRSITFVIPGDVATRITVTELDDGRLKFDLAIDDDSASIGDLRGLFFDLSGIDSSTYGLSVDDGGTGIVTDQAYAEGAVNDLGNGANIKGSVSKEFGDFDAGIEFGTSGEAKDDIRGGSFVLSASGGPLSLDMLNLADFGIRYTSVGDEGGSRKGSLKLGHAGVGVASHDVASVLENSDPTASGNRLNLLDNDQTTDEGGAARGVQVAAVSGLMLAGATFVGDLVAQDGMVLGTIEVDTDGEVRITALADALAAGEERQILLEYVTLAADGAEATATLTVTITGTNDAPVIAASTLEGAVTEIGDGAAGENAD
ncbi:VCBS domain-containing protein, partial [Limimaricola variabilis]